MTTPYAPPVDRLLALGDPEDLDAPYADYRALGLTPEHAAELLRMANDPALRAAETYSAEEVARMHAWRVLGQLGVEEAAAPLVALLREHTDDELIQEDLPRAVAMIGRAAIEPARALLGDENVGVTPRIGGISVLGQVAIQHPELRDEAVGVLVAQLSMHMDQDPDINAFVVGELAELRATEAAPAIQAAYEAETVSEFWVGDWEDVQVRMGLLEKRTTPSPRSLGSAAPVRLGSLPALLPRLGEPSARPSTGGQKARAKPKNRRKDAKASRKRNRRK
jgi:hypothetical protein